MEGVAYALTMSRAPTTIVLAVLLAGGCGGGSDAPPRSAAPAIPVETAEVKPEDVDVIVEAVGSLEADQSIEVKARRAGRIASLPVEEGSRVETGVALVNLEDQDLTALVGQAEAAVREAEVREASARRSRDRSQTLRRKGIASEQDHDDVEAEHDRAAAALEVARANLAFARAELDKTVLVAPFDGIVGRLTVDVGAFVSQGEPLGRLIDDDPLEVVFALPERYVSRLALDLPIQAYVSSLPERPFPGRVTFIDPAIDPANRTVTVKAEIPNPERLLRPGQFGTVRVRLERHVGAPVVPEEAVVPTAERLLIFVVEEGQASARTVRTGVRLPGRVEIVSGLVPGETIVVTGHEKLREGEAAPVRAVQTGSEADRSAG